MNPKKLLSILFAFCALGAMAQKYQVSGTIIEADTKEVLPQVSVQLLGKDSTRIAATNTNEKGEFLLKAKADGEYIVVARMIGFVPFVRNVTLTAERPTRTMNIGMKPSTKELDEVNVSALSRMMTMKNDTLLFSSAALRMPPNASLATLMN